MFKQREQRRERPVDLNISSLMDIMTILLLFLLMSFESQEQRVEPPRDIDLPASLSERIVKLAVKVSASMDELRVEDDVVLRLREGRFLPADVNDITGLVDPLLQALNREKARLLSGVSTVVGQEDESQVLYFEATKAIPYEVLDTVMKTAAVAGFSRFRLAVRRKF